MVYRTGATRGDVGGNVLVYVVEVTNRANVRDMVFVDATSRQAGQPLLAGPRRALPRASTSSRRPATLVWNEGDPFPGALNEDQQNIVRRHGRVLLVLQERVRPRLLRRGRPRHETVNNDPRISCPNANWNGVTTNYCNGVTSDDVVAHEWGHAYTEYTHGLIYQWQSGALNESYSDIWGETVDLINGRMDEDEGDLTTKRPAASAPRTPAADRLTINTPAVHRRPVPRRCASFGPVFDAGGVTADVVVGQDARRPRAARRQPTGAPRSPTPAPSPATSCYVDRGTCTFQVKVNNAQAAGATGIVVGNNVAGRGPFDARGDSRHLRR